MSLIESVVLGLMVIAADSGADYYEQKYRQRVVSKLEKTAQSLGFQLVPQSQDSA